MNAEYEDFYLSAGIALEQAMKTRLARENVAFIAPERGFKSAVALWRTRGDIEKLPVGTLTIGGVEALARVREIEPTFGRHVESVKQVLRFRNGEAHIGAPGSSDHRRVFADFASALTSLLRTDADDFWAEHADFVRVAIDESATVVSKEVAERLSAGALTFGRKFGLLDEQQRKTLLALIEQERDRQTDDDALKRDCPACSSPAVLRGENVVEYDLEFDRDARTVTNAHPYVEFRASELECLACELVLSGSDEIEGAEMETTFVNDEVDFVRYMRDYFGEDEYG